jgi:hypothetical protein
MCSLCVEGAGERLLRHGDRRRMLRCWGAVREETEGECERCAPEACENEGECWEVHGEMFVFLGLVVWKWL